MASRSLDISVVICAYTQARWHDLVAAVHSVHGQSMQPQDIIVVVDHNPLLLERVHTEVPHVIAVENQEAQGLSGARNSGIAAATGAVIAFLDDDGVAAPDWLEQLLPAYANPEVIGVGGTVEPLWLHGRPPWFPAEFDWVVGCTYRGMPEVAAPVRNLIGCNMSFRREVLAGVGGFRSGIGRVGTYPAGCEETELCIRVGRRWPSKTLLYEPRARVQHRVTARRARWGYFRSRCYAEGLSKALVAQAVGAGDGLASERAYTLRTLPRAVVRGVADSLRGDLSALTRAGAIMAGLAVTTAGYLMGTVAEPRATPPKAEHEVCTSAQGPVLSTARTSPRSRTTSLRGTA
jgi:glucosyl-dolichyl phosphate glucuronosyltransferase